MRLRIFHTGPLGFGILTTLTVVWFYSPASALGASALPWASGQEMRTLAVNPQPSSKVGYALMSSEATGVRFTNELRGDLSLTNAVAHNGSGLAIGDVDGDEWPDLYFCSLQGPNRLYRNLGSWRFEEMVPGPAACADQLSTAAALADIDGDGDLDLLVNGISRGTRLFLNDGQGGWSEKRDAGLSQTASPTSMALADIDGDGDLDLYCAHYVDVMHLADPTTRFALAREASGWRVSKVNGESTHLPKWQDRFEVLPNGRVRELPELDGLYRNDGQGRFTSIVSDPGRFLGNDGTPAGPFREWGLAVMFRDLNGDGAPDLYVCNDNASPDRVWLNTGTGTFRMPDPWAFRHTSRSSMGVDVADVNRDGHVDIFVLDMLARSRERRMMQLVRDYPDPAAGEQADEVPRYNRNMLFLGRADGSFSETALMAGVAATDWSWCPIFLDVDLDGYEDLLVTNGFEFDVMDQDSHDQLRTMRLSYDQRKRFRQFHPAWPTPNAAFRNRQDGTFEEVSEAWGFNTAGVSHGMALGDLDNDGDLDVVINNLNASAGLYRNESAAGRLGVRLKGLPPNTHGIGARLRLAGGPVPQSQEMISGGRYLSSDQAQRVFATGPGANQTLQLEVIWRNGDRTMHPVQPNTICEVVQFPPGAQAVSADRAAQTGWFTDVSALLQYSHAEDDLDDWQSQPLLPRRLSRLGPGLAWFDANADGWLDLAATSARGGRLALFLNQGGEGFRRVESATSATGDQGSLVGWPDGKGRRHMLAAQSNFNVGKVSEANITIYSLEPSGPVSNLSVHRALPFGMASPGPLTLADVDGDNDLDLFAGARFLPGRYPEPVSSLLYLNQDGELRPDAERSRPFASVGLASGATFADLDQDGDPDLALAVEWGPLKVFRNEQGRFEEVTSVWGLAGLAGWWTGVAAGDFDGDGRLDLAAGNWGRNSIEELNRHPGRALFYGDADGNGTMEIVEACPAANSEQNGSWFPTRPRSWVERGFPDLPTRFPTHQAYGRAEVREILGSRAPLFRKLEANHFESGVFLNRGGRFEWMAFPSEAQQAPVFAVCVGDFDGDGAEDVFLSQNFFGAVSDLSREDSGSGLWLRGKGDGTFQPAETGIKILGEQRAAALADFDQDGRVDLAITQNNGAARLYRNERARPGLRVVLKGPPGNPEGVGAQLRLQFADGRRGPVRSIQAGSGYWSQESAVQVLALIGRIQSAWVRWPDGSEQTIAMEENQFELVVDYKNDSP